MALNQMIFHHILQWIRCYDIGVADIVFASLGCDRLFFLSRSIWRTPGKMIFFFIFYWNRQFEFNWFSWWKVKMQWNKWFAYMMCRSATSTFLLSSPHILVSGVYTCNHSNKYSDNNSLHEYSVLCRFCHINSMRKNHKLPRESYVSLY